MLVGLLTKEFGFAFKLGLIICIGMSLLHVMTSYVRVIRHNSDIRIQSLNKILYIKNVKQIKTWWCYDYGASSIEIGEGTQGKSRPSTNKINCYARIEGNGEEIFIYEQIHFSDKFPNNHPYSHDEDINKSRTVRVWDVDKCLKALGLIDL